MVSRNTKLVNEFKRVEKICSEIYGDKNGVTQYINDMKSVSSNISRAVPEWNDTLKKLKLCREIRNDIIHGDLEIDGDDCSDEIIEWLRSFYDKILNQKDPVTEITLQKNSDISVKQTEKNNDRRNEKSNYSFGTSKIIVNRTQEDIKREKRITNILFVIVILPVLILLLVIIIALGGWINNRYFSSKTDSPYGINSHENVFDIEMPCNVDIYDYNGEISSKLIINEIITSSSNPYSLGLAITVKGEKTYGTSDYDTVYYKIYDSENYVVTDGLFMLSSIDENDKFIDDSLRFYDYEPGKKYRIVFYSKTY